MTDLLATALGYARRGWPVFPIERGGKRPLGKLVRHGLKDATTDPATIQGWWRAQPEANIGLPTGLAVDVLDIDGPDALEAFENAGPLGGVRVVDGHPVHGHDVEGPTVATPRGWHCYVAPTGRGNTVNVGGLPGVDWRGGGGYVVAPPSRKSDGGSWSWITGPVDLGPDTAIRPAPRWVLDLLDRRPASVADVPTTVPRHIGRTGYGATALKSEVARVLAVAEGGRNHTLNVAAMKLGTLVPTGALTAEDVALALYAAGRQVGLEHRETVGTIRSGLSAGMQRPRRVAS